MTHQQTVDGILDYMKKGFILHMKMTNRETETPEVHLCKYHSPCVEPKCMGRNMIMGIKINPETGKEAEPSLVCLDAVPYYECALIDPNDFIGQIIKPGEDVKIEEKFPATMEVHTPQGPMFACDKHAGAMGALMSFMGVHINSTPAPPDVECSNCRNEAQKK